jgi:hypothetical protein
MLNRPQPGAALTYYHPPHLQEVASLLGAGLVRLRRHTAEELLRDAPKAEGQREVSLDSQTKESGRANPKEREHA